MQSLVYICVHGATHFWGRLSWIADVAALVTRQAGLSWEEVTKTARETGAERMLHLGLRLASDLLQVRLPHEVGTAVRQDKSAAKLAAKVRAWLVAGNASPTLFERAAFRLPMRGNAFSAPAFLLRLFLSPTEEGWHAGGKSGRPGLLEAWRRPFRLARKYGSSSRT